MIKIGNTIEKIMISFDDQCYVVFDDDYNCSSLHNTPDKVDGQGKYDC